ncbi:MAG TPA: S8 family serine peptidase [Chloroflexia bacterium]|nr:S8 family serine peptidase [Chloroflexia bacterium]
MPRPFTVQHLILPLFVLAIALAAALPTAQPGVRASAPPAPASKVESKVLADTANGQSTSAVILLADQADLSAAYTMTDQDARGWYVYTTLHSHAEQSQQPLRALLAARGLPYQAFWVANALITTLDRPLVDLLAARADVRAIESNATQRWIEDPAIADLHAAPAAATTIEYGVQNVNAPQVWAMGYTGQGIVVGNADTGMRWTHAALKPHYRGWNGTTADHNYNWHDAIHDATNNPCGNNSQVPCDDNGHGTHTTGTTTGDDGSGNQIGVAPGAKWIGCHNMDQGNGTPARYTECFQWFIAPTDLSGNNPDPTKRPHVINNSWECPASEGCAALTLQTIVDSTQAAGIFVEASAQNSGPGCSTVQNPPAIYASAFSTGAYDINNTLAGFSSRGPVTADGSNRLKPNISAPGVNNRSSYSTSDTSYANLSGTSMAGPHVVGVVALLWSARPQLARDITTTKTILQNTANPNVIVSPVQTCGGIPSSQIPNNSFGYGRVDALAAVNSVVQFTPTPTATGTPPTATRTVTATSTPPATSTNTATASPTACGVPAAWSDQTHIPVNKGRAVGVNLGPAIFLFGGRPDNTVYTQDIYRYDLNGNSWTLLPPQLPDAMTSNMAGGVLTFPEGVRIFIAGGSGTGSVLTGRTLAFNPFDGSFTTKATWPAAPLRLPGGWAVANNKFYVFGGYNPAGPEMRAEIWAYDPMTDSWAQSSASLSQARGYIATELMPDGQIYLAGGSQYSGGTLTDETTFEKFNPATNMITSGPALPLGRSNDHGYNVGGKFVVPSGGFTTSTTDVVVYDPAANSWSMGTPSLFPVRNYAKGYGLNGAIHMFGGTADSAAATYYPYNQKYTPAVACVTPSATPTSTFAPTATAPAINTATATSTVGATNTVAPTATATSPPAATATRTAAPTNTVGPSATPCTLSFTDVHATDYFYTPVLYLACHGVISGYANGDGTFSFRPYNNTTRSQMVKIVVLGYNKPIVTPAGGNNTFADVPTSNPFFAVIETAAADTIVSGYNCGGPNEPCDSAHRPYFRPYANVTRGQLSKIDVVAAGWALRNPATGSFEDVLAGTAFYQFVETAYCHGVISGYTCGGPGEPCDGTNRPYFRQFNQATRGQIAKIVYLSITSGVVCGPATTP